MWTTIILTCSEIIKLEGGQQEKKFVKHLVKIQRMIKTAINIV